MNRTQAKVVNERVMSALSKIENDLGITFSCGNTRYGDSEVSFKVTGIDNARDGSSVSKEAVDFERYAFQFGLKSTDLGRTFTQGTKTYKIVGIKPRGRKYPILVEDGVGNKYKMSSSWVSRALGVA